ncbi:uracil-DNA glycosylase family protein [Aurantiacibacter sp. D1-12]|uniref:uracil-DNA glycosylase family protein n=1 Tax=Aurantiacibacter sp. D1-12 TaxID=2993658 RepID=UPI00237C5FE2|nr:uracil-DNA glycosylase family protein [Aurantiacibacter sp. D1-12]MDE1466139.1 uracil-DNA glycosylase family protein [Aurantiacibacter sp. D1-12]
MSDSIKACGICEDLPLGPNPIFQIGKDAKILIAGQAPGRITHRKGMPFDDPSGDRLRDWLGISRETFYDANKIAIVPMAFCFPGTGKSSDLPPRAECEANWRRPVLEQLPNIELTLVIGKYAMDWHLGDEQAKTLTQTVQNWRHFWPEVLPLPHPSPRNNIWLKKNPWFPSEVLPALGERVAAIIG